MGRDWVDHPSWELVEEASSTAGRNLEALLLSAPMEELTQTAEAQLATFVQSLIVLDAVERLGISPAACAGHSLGEYTALVAAGALPFDDGIRLVMARGDAMARATEDMPGTMAALIGISDDDAEAACHLAEGEVWVANYNGPGQVVVAGTTDAVAAVSSVVRQMGARRVLPIPVAGAFHTPLMAGARPALRKALGDVGFAVPEVPVVANIDARAHDDDAWPALLSAQLCAPVRWRQTQQTLASLGASVLVELGPGGVLTGLARRGLPDVRAISLAVPDDLDELMDALAAPEAAEPEADAVHHLHHGEHLYVSERVVVSPAGGVFSPESSLQAPGAGLLPGTAGEGSPGSSVGGAAVAGRADAAQANTIEVGDLVGRVGDAEVRTPFSGEVVRWLAASGERVQPGQPVLWLRVPGNDR